MPKLLQIDSCLNMGSTGRITESIAKLAIGQGWDCYIIHGARYSNPPSCMKAIQSVSKFGEYIHYIEGLFFDNHGLASRNATRKVIRKIKEIKPDVIQIHCIHGYYLNYKILFEYLNTTNIPIVWTFHDCWAFTGHCSHFINAGCYKWKEEGCNCCPLMYDYPRSLVDHSTRNFITKKEIFSQNPNLHIVTVSNWLEDIVRQSFFNRMDIQTIYNGVDIDLFKPRNDDNLRKKLNLQGKHVLLAAATAWSEGKGLLDYYHLSSLLSEDMILVLVGLTISQIKEICTPKIIGLPRTESADELANYYSMADIVLNLSYAETFGLTTAEGMSCGTPGIVYNTTACPELVNEETGIVVEKGDVNGVMKAIVTILKNGKEHYSSNCRDRALLLYDKNRQYKEYIQLYEKLIKTEGNLLF